MRKIILLYIFFCFFLNKTFSQIAKDLQLTDDKLRIQLTRMPVLFYSFKCYVTEPFALAALNSWKMEEMTLDMNPETITEAEENKFGDDMYKQMVNSGEYKFIETGAKYNALQKMLKELLECRSVKKRNISYSIYLIDDKFTVNAFTCGGHIYITTAMLNFSKTVSEIASIIAHEIGHSEEYDINRILKSTKIAGEFTHIALTVENLLKSSWNQFNEHRADSYGVALAAAAGYSPCATVDLWNRMNKEQDSKPNMFEKFFRTHPFSDARADCISAFIKEELKIDCN